jgi:hypothetical protein
VVKELLVWEAHGLVKPPRSAGIPVDLAARLDAAQGAHLVSGRGFAGDTQEALEQGFAATQGEPLG